MAKKPSEPFVMLPRDLLRSDAWRSMGINERRLIDFLLLEHLRHGGKQNGNLKAPRKQLHAFGIGTRFVSSTITAVEERGMIQCRRGGMRVAITYALTWLATADNVVPTNAWRDYRNPTLRPMAGPKFRNLASLGKSVLTSEGKSDGTKLTYEGKSDAPQNLVAKGIHPSRSTIPRKSEGSGEECAGAEVVALRAFAGVGTE